MNNHALKLVREKGSVSLKIHDLFKMPEEEFSDQAKQFLYENAKEYHKSQKGILRVSKYEFYSEKQNRLKMLKKHPIKIVVSDRGFDYAEGNKTTKIWYMNFADQEAFDDIDSKGFTSLSDLQIMEMPLLHKVNRFLKSDSFVCISPTTYYKDGKFSCPTPILFENVPQWVTVKDFNVTSKNQKY